MVAGLSDGRPTGPVIVFDSKCVLCAANARFVLRNDRKRHFHLASMYGALGIALYRQHGLDPADPDSLIVVDGDRLLRDSDAVLAIYAGCGWPWTAASILTRVPRSIRDRAYRWVARNRYRIFGRRETCWLPSADDRDRVS